jgi:tetratricopeptide (TPR) repeat protein/predicted aspartyl protease
MKLNLAVAAMGLGLSLAASPVLAACGLGQIAQLAVTMTDSAPMITAKINGADARFVADSGAFYSLLSPSSAAEHALRLGPVPFDLTLSGVGGDVAVSLATVKIFTIAGVAIPNVQFLVGGSEPAAGADGLIGQNVLGLADVEYDLANGVIRLMKARGCGDKVLAYWAGAKPYSVMDINGANAQVGHTTGFVFINGVRIGAIFDTGAWASVLSRRAAARAGVKPGNAGVIDEGATHGIGRHTMETWVAPFASFKIGDEEIRHTRLRFGDLDLGEGVDMLVGADFFLSHRIFVANSQRRLYFTYNGGPVFNLDAAARTQTAADQAPKAAPTSGEGQAGPADADGFAARGAAFAARRDYDHAIADLTRACEMAPTEPRYFYERGMARWANGQNSLAMADFDQSLRLKPDDISARVARAEMLMASHDSAAAAVDLDAAARLAPKQADARFDIAELYIHANRLEPAIAQFSLWIGAHPQDSRLALALNGRCRARALTARDLDKALVDCNAALKLHPRSPDMLATRGLVWLQMGDFDKAIAGFDASLKLEPKSAWSLYSRGLAERRKGLKAQGETDIAAAVALQPDIADETRKYGIAP